MPDSEKSKLVKQLRKNIEGCRELIVSLNSILLWEKSWYPGLIFAITTTIFLIIWTYDLTLLTIVSLALWLLAVFDYLLFNVLESLIFIPNAWNGTKERKFTEICENLSDIILYIQNIWTKIINARNTSPKIYYLSLSVGLIALAWIGNVIHNLFLLYLTANLLLLMPGFRYKGRGYSALKQAYHYLIHLQELDHLKINDCPSYITKKNT